MDYNNNVVTIGTALKWRNTFDLTKKYYQENIVTACGCVFRCKVLQTQGLSPIKISDEDGHIVYINTDVWDVLVDMAEYYNFAVDTREHTQQTLDYTKQLDEAIQRQQEEIESLEEQIEEISLAPGTPGSTGSTVPEIDIANIDTMGTDGSLTELRKLVKRGSTAMYAIMRNNIRIGTMSIISTDMLHVLTQIMTTHLTLDVDSTAHTDDRVKTWYRVCPLSSSVLPEIGEGNWGPWIEIGCGPECKESISEMQVIISELRSEVSNLKEALDRQDINYATMVIEWLEDEGTNSWSRDLPNRIDRSIRIRACAVVNGSIITTGISNWQILRYSDDTEADGTWNLKKVFSMDVNGYIYITLAPADINEDTGVIFRFSAMYTRESNGVTYSQIIQDAKIIGIGGLVFFSDRGKWAEGEQYRYLTANENGRVETSDVWRYGNRWRALQTHVSSLANGPGYGHEEYWEWIGGDPEPKVSFVEVEQVVSKADPSIPLTLQVIYHGEDITALIADSDVVWSRESTDLTGASRTALDAAWNSRNASRGKEVVFTGADIQSEYQGYSEGLKDLKYTAEVTIRDPQTSQPLKMARAAITL